MNIPGFTAEVSLNSLGEYYATTAQASFAKSGQIVGQQLSGGVVPNPSYLILEDCSSCFRYPNSKITCNVIKVNPALASRTYLGQVALPKNCWDQCIL